MAFRVLDSSAFYAGIPFSSNEPSYITPLIYNEIEHIKKDHDAVRILIETKRLTVCDPEHRFIVIANDAMQFSPGVNLNYFYQILQNLDFYLNYEKYDF